MVGYALRIILKESFVRTKKGIFLDQTFIPEKLIKVCDEINKMSFTIVAGWELREHCSGDVYIIVYPRTKPQIKIEIEAKFIDCIQTSTRL